MRRRQPWSVEAMSTGRTIESVKYCVGAEDTKRITSRGIRAGQMVEKSDDSQLMPTGVLHAVRVGADVPVCRTARPVHVFDDHDWEATMASDRCPDCSESIAG
jgi:hypothetical protein